MLQKCRSFRSSIIGEHEIKKYKAEILKLRGANTNTYNIVGKSPEFVNILQTINRVADLMLIFLDHLVLVKLHLLKSFIRAVVVAMGHLLI